MQPLGEPFDHAFDHRPALLGAKLGRRRNLLVARVATRTTRCAGARASGSDASERASQHIDPRRIGWRGLEQRAPSSGGLAVVTVLLGSIATGKYVDILLAAFGERLVFPVDFVGRGDMSRGGLLLRSARDNNELGYSPVLGAVRPATLKKPPARIRFAT